MKMKALLVWGIRLIVDIGILTLPWSVIYLGLIFEPNPPKPKITYWEFPFKLEYKINEEHKVVEDTLICEFDGFKMNEGLGKYRKWKSLLKSGNKKIILLQINDTDYLYYDPGYAGYYLGDSNNANAISYEEYFPNASRLERDGNFTSDGIIMADELLNKYNITLISWQPSEPIVNEFE